MCALWKSRQWHGHASCGSVQYSLWLDQHSTDEVLKFIKGALNTAAAKIDQDEDCKELVAIMTKLCLQS